MKKLISVLLILLGLGVSYAHAEEYNEFYDENGKLVGYTMNGVYTALYDERYEYRIEDGQCYIDSCWYWGDGTEIELVIPEEIEGCPVVSIGPYAFYCFENVERILIPDSVTSIGEYAFYGCKGIKQMVIPDSVTQIGAGAFYQCSSLQEVNIPNGVTCIEWGLFYDCENLKQVRMSESLKDIKAFAFFDCTSLRELYLPMSVSSI